MTPDPEARIAEQEAENAALRAQVELLAARVEELLARLAEDSHNSGKPPCSDGLKRKSKSLRKRSGKRPGGQLGHRGETLRLVATPDDVVEHRPPVCRGRIMLYMTKKEISGGVVHELPEDLRKTLASDAEALAAWEELTPLARNEWICWAISVKKPETRRQHVDRVRTELKEGMRRPCCWIGCIHRTDKPISPSVQYVLNRQSKRSS